MKLVQIKGGPWIDALAVREIVSFSAVVGHEGDPIPDRVKITLEIGNVSSIIVLNCPSSAEADILRDRIGWVVNAVREAAVQEAQLISEK